MRASHLVGFTSKSVSHFGQRSMANLSREQCMVSSKMLVFFFLILALYPQQIFLCTILLIIPEIVAYSSRGQPSFINEKVA